MYLPLNVYYCLFLCYVLLVIVFFIIICYSLLGNMLMFSYMISGNIMSTKDQASLQDEPDTSKSVSPFMYLFLLNICCGAIC